MTAETQKIPTTSQSVITPLEKGLSAASVGVSAAAAAHELTTSGWAHIPGVESLPGIDHSSSVAGGMVGGMLGGLAVEKASQLLERRGFTRPARTLRRLGFAATMAASTAAQLAVETNPSFGVSDKWDLITGVAATVPGFMVSRGIRPSPTKHSSS